MQRIAKIGKIEKSVDKSVMGIKKNLNSFVKVLKRYQTDIILVVGVILISLLSFAIGYIVAKQQKKEPIIIEYGQTPFSARDTSRLQNYEEEKI